MTNVRVAHSVVSRLAAIGLALGLAITATVAEAGWYHGGHHGYHGHGYLGHGHYAHRYYGHRYYGHRYHGYRPYAYHLGYVPGVAHGVLSIPGAGVGSLFGYHHGPYLHGRYHDRTYDGEADRGAAPAAPAVEPDNTGDSLGQGWRELTDGRYAQALSTFSREAAGDPRNGRPKVGYALSAAATGDLARGVWAMRRALSIDPDAMRYVTIDAALRPRLEALVGQYLANSDPAVAGADAAFMLASLHYLLGDIDSARNAIALAVADADGDPSTADLKRMVDDAVADGPRQARRGDATVAGLEAPGADEY